MRPVAQPETLRIHRIVENTAAEGFGRRMCVWVQGCGRHCPGCMAQDTWAYEGGEALSLSDLTERMERQAGTVEGITLLGGEPFDQALPLSRFAFAAQKRGLSVIAFTGYVLEELLEDSRPGVKALLAQTDLLIDGPYIREQRSFARPWVGSENQRYHFLTGRYAPEDLKHARNRVEVRLRPDGALDTNGMADFPALLEMLLRPPAASPNTNETRERTP